MIDMRKIYNFYPLEDAPPAGALPTGAELYYECLDCEKVVSSVPHIKVACACGNLHRPHWTCSALLRIASHGHCCARSSD